MQKFSAQIRRINEGKLSRYIGIIDVKMFESRDANSLYYLFPLIERTVLEILKVKDESDVEVIRKGNYRTLYSLIEIPENKKHFSDKEIDELRYFFKDNGLRNKLMHYSSELEFLKVSPSEIARVKCISILLLEKLESLINDCMLISPKPVELLKIEK